MTKTIKWLLIIVGGLAALLVAAMILVALFVDPNDYKDRIARTVQEATGMELTIEGDLSLRVFPWLGVDTGAVRLGNPPGFGDEPFVSLNSSSVSLQVLPLLSGSIKAGQIDVQGLTVNLLRRKDGAANWEAIGGNKPEQQESAQGAADGSGGKLDLSIGGLSVNDANIVFNDLQANKRFSLDGLNLTLGEVSPGEPFDMEAALGLASSEPQVKAVVRVKAVAALDLDKQIYELRDLDATVSAEGDVVPGGKTDVTAKAVSVLADMGKQLVTTEGLTVTAYGVDVAADVAASELKTGPKAKGSLTVKPFDVKKLLTALGQTPPETTDPTALTNVSLALDFDYGPAAATARNVVLNLDGQEITAEASMIAGNVPSYGFKVQAASLDLDPYRAPKKDEQAQPAETQSADPASANQPLLPESVQEQLRKLRLDGQIKIGRLKASPAEITNLLVLITARDGLLKIEPASFTFYEGDLKSAISMDVRGTVPNYGFNADLNGLAIGPLLEALQGKESLSGKTNAEAALTVRGNTVDELKQTLNGNLRFDIHDGVFPGVDLAGVMTKAYKSLQAKADGEIQTQEDARTQFGLVQGSATIVNGLVDNRDLLFKSPFLQADGAGEVSLPENSINYLVVGAILASTEGQGRGDKADYVGIGIPIRIKGNFDNLHFWPDPVKWAEMIAKGALNIVGDGANGVLSAPGALLDAVTGGSKSESGGTDQPAEKKTTPLEDIGGAVKGLF
ncbi:AsmA family protein [Paucidesulfovibrio longus]|uniref:AsmA family protein n=1 Tax=Paucidesulfovibrio longus TaxID=889 RepID=UPI0003B40B90|nr:AsmA family protein [Paucidesulfovibrio longus]